MRPLLTFLLQIAAAVPTADSTYATPALRAVVERAAVENRRVPAALSGYSATIESELAVIFRDSIGRELNPDPQQVAGDVEWTPERGADVRITALRTPPFGVPLSLTSLVRSWFTPTLYGERIHLGFDLSVGTSAADPEARTVRESVHPLAVDRDRYYRFSGGDTVTTIVFGGRRIPVVRVTVTPRAAVKNAIGIFEGEIDLDATRSQIVRMRGRFVNIAVLGIHDYIFAELENAEVDGAYWLPVYQRVELQGSWPLISNARATVRAVSSIQDYHVVSDPTRVPGANATGDAVRIHVAFSDSATTHQRWGRELGEATSSVSSSDFADVGPERDRPSGRPLLVLATTRSDHALHYDRVEGVYTGVESSVYFRDAAPGVVARAFGGWGWTEQTARGGVALSRTTPGHILGVTVERALESTNDFQWHGGDSPPRYGSLLGSIDDNDYVDRSTAKLWWSLASGIDRRSLLTATIETGRDRSEVSRVRHALLAPSVHFRPNRGAADGGYGLAAIEYEFLPPTLLGGSNNAVGGRLHYEAAGGGLNWQRAELSGIGRRSVGSAVTVTSHLDLGYVRSSVLPPQQLFELGGSEELAGYSYKEFAGDRAASFNVLANVAAPILKGPRHIGRWSLPGLHPGIGAGIESAWSELSTQAARFAAAGLAAGDPSLTIPAGTAGIRGSITTGITLFSGGVLLGVSRPIDHRAPWRLALGLGFLD
jgi:hypothetical protein